MRDMVELSGTGGPVHTPQVMRPVVFSGLFGWLHATGGAMADTGVVLISPLGRDERCAHQSMRLLADQLAEAGFPTLRYDHRGEGDSLDLAAPEADAFALWLEDVERAVDELRQRTGVERVVLGGVRLGASFAALQAAHVDGLLLLAPILNGRAWLKRLRFSANVVKTPTVANAGDLALDSGGLVLKPATAAGLSAFDLDLAPPPALPLFVAAQNRMVRGWAERRQAAFAGVTISDFPGFDALFLDAHSNEPPLALFAGVRDWMRQRFGPAFLEGGRASSDETEADLVELHPPGAAERAMTFGEGLRGILCLPDQIDPDAPTLLFLNTGGDPRPGIGSFATTAARRLAGRGAASLRFDFAGLGDSAATGSDIRSHVYETSRAADLDAALGLLEGQGLRNICVFGVCAGAHHALRLGVHDPRVTRIFAVNPVKLVWRRGDSLAEGEVDEGKATQTYIQAVRDRQTWKRLMEGEVDLRAVARTFYLRLKAHALGMISRLRGDSPLAEMRAFARRGGRAHLLMGLDDASIDETRVYFGPDAAKLTALPGMSVRVDPALDHGLARGDSRAIALDELMAWLGI